jgi:hypothetical protein
VKWDYELNARTMKLRVTERPTDPDKDGLAIADAKWQIMKYKRTTDISGKAEFPKLPKGQYPTTIEHPNYIKNTEDSDENNDFVDVPETTDKKYILHTTRIDITVSAKYIKGFSIVKPQELPSTQTPLEECCG